MSASTNPHVEIRPKPANERNNSGAVGQIVTPRRRAGPLVFVNSSDLNTENEKQGNRKMVKKWAMLNRNARYMRPSTSSSQKAQFLSWDSRDVREPSSASTITSASSSADESTSPTYTASSRDDLTATATERNVAPLQPNASVADQLNNLCMDIDPHAKGLLENFLRGGQNETLLPSGRLVSCNRGAFPMISRSRAALCSMIATLEANPNNPKRSGSKDYRDYYLSMALMYTNSLIQKMESGPTPVVFFCVSLLMWTAKYMEDKNALQAHFTGMIALMVRHWDLFTISPYFRNGPYFWTLPTNEGNIVPGAEEPSIYNLPTDDMNFFVDVSDFSDLQTHGWISSDLVSFLPNVLAMNALIPRARNKQLALEGGKDLYAYILFNARSITKLESAAMTQFEHCVRMVVAIQYYSFVFQNPQQGVGWLSDSIYAHLMQMDLHSLMTDFPRALLWIALSAGHFATGSSRTWWLEFLNNMIDVLSWTDFDDAISVLENRLLWSRSLDTVARAFWNDAVNGSSRRASAESL